MFPLITSPDAISGWQFGMIRSLPVSDVTLADLFSSVTKLANEDMALTLKVLVMTIDALRHFSTE